MKEKKEDGEFNIAIIVPQMVTFSAICFSLTSIKCAIAGNFSLAAMFIILAAFIDGIDGRVARLLNASSEFGVQMDSLADFFNFGIAPGFIMYFWQMHNLDSFGRIGWVAVLLLAICMAIRLARFNVDTATEDKDSPLVKYFFKGIPAPAAGLLVLFPLIATIEFGVCFYSSPVFVTINTMIIALLAGSTIPTPCFKKIKIKPAYKNIVILLFAIILIGLVTKLWLTMSIIGASYLIMIVCGWFFYAKFKKQIKK